MYVYILKLAMYIYKNPKKSSICQVGKAKESKGRLNALINSDSKYLASKFCDLMVWFQKFLFKYILSWIS